MAFSGNDMAAYSAEEGCDTCLRGSVAGTVGNTGASIDATAGRRQTGDFGIILAMNSAVGGRFLPITTTSVGNISVGTPEILVFSCAVSLSGDTVSSAMPLLVNTSGTGQYVKIGTDRKLYFYDRDGNQVGVSTSTIPVAGSQEVHIVLDGLTIDTVYIKVYFGSSEDAAFDTYLPWADFFEFTNPEDCTFVWGSQLISGVADTTDYGADIYLDDCYAARSTTVGDAPHLTAYPRPRGNGGDNNPPESEGDTADWTASDNPSPNTHLDVDEAGDENGDTDYIESVDETEIHLFESDTANILPDPCTVLKAQDRFAAKVVSGEKMGCYFYYKLNGNTSTGTTGGWGVVADYEGWLDLAVSRPGGGPWDRADADANTLQFGVYVIDLTPTFDSAPRVTKMCGPEWWYYEDTLDAGTTPTLAVAGMQTMMIY